MLQAYAYRFDAHGNVLEVDDYCDKPSTASPRCCDPSAANSCSRELSASYAYDPLDRLIHMGGAGAAPLDLPYAYDNAGNLRNKEGQE